MEQPTSLQNAAMQGVARIKELTNGIGADSVLECVGTAGVHDAGDPLDAPGGPSIGYVGVPHGMQLNMWRSSSSNSSVFMAALRRCAGIYRT